MKDQARPANAYTRRMPQNERATENEAVEQSLDQILADAETRVRRYLGLYNELENALRESLGISPEAFERRDGLGPLSREYAKQHAWWRSRDQLVQKHVGMRAFLTHEAGVTSQLFAVPLDTAIESLGTLLSAASNPTRVLPLFGREVKTVSPETPLTSVLEVIRDKSITYYPVFRDSTFHGIVTGNGIAHWLASRLEYLSLVELDDVAVKDLLDLEEEAHKKARFIHKRTLVQDAFDAISRDPIVEVLIITDSGKEHERPLGIVTPSDVATHRERI